jgi:hypothetical protein
VDQYVDIKGLCSISSSSFLHQKIKDLSKARTLLHPSLALESFLISWSLSSLIFIPNLHVKTIWTEVTRVAVVQLVLYITVVFCGGEMDNFYTDCTDWIKDCWVFVLHEEENVSTILTRQSVVLLFVEMLIVKNNMPAIKVKPKLNWNFQWNKN